MKFKIGIEVERTSSTILIVECEAGSLDEAKRIALRGAMDHASKARSFSDLFKNSSSFDVDWLDEHFSANAVSDEIPQDQMEHYSADFVVAQ